MYSKQLNVLIINNKQGYPKDTFIDIQQLGLENARYGVQLTERMPYSA